MIALMIVSHSARLADGVAELAQQMAPNVPIFTAGGTGDGGIGTSFEQVMSGLQQAMEHEGVVIFTDLGSSVMVAEMALEALDARQQDQIRLSKAPLVEGVVVAAVAAASGIRLDGVAAAADETGASRDKHRENDTVAVASDRGGQPTPGIERALPITNTMGLHARPAAQIVKALGVYHADIQIGRADQPGTFVSARSLLSLLSLNARRGQTLVVRAQGADADKALAAIETLFQSDFHEPEEALLPPQLPQPATHAHDVPANALHGVSVSSGGAIGRVMRLDETVPEVPESVAEAPPAEEARLIEALNAVARELTAQITRAGEDSTEAAILQTHLLLLNDPLLIGKVRARINEKRDNAAHAWLTVVSQEAETLRALPEGTAAERAADLLDVGQRVIRQLLGWKGHAQHLKGAIVIAEDIPPSEVAVLARAGVAGIVLEKGTPTAHSAILARSFGLPMVVAVGGLLKTLAPDTSLLLDATRGLLVSSPTAEQVSGFRRELERQNTDNRENARVAGRTAQTRNGSHITVEANVASLEDARSALSNGAEGVGLLRTEFLYAERSTLPDEEEEVAMLQAVLEPLGDLPIVVRTLDVGGDKPMPALALDPAIHSFLGVRGLRFSLQQPDLFRRQLRAILRVARGRRLSLMFPMVTTTDEVIRALALLREAEQSLDDARLSRGELQGIGVMIEVPAAALALDKLAAVVDFFSVGSNDLIQYTMAADRTNTRVASLHTAHHPAIFRLLAQVATQAARYNRPISICGEMAGDPALTPVLLGLGIHKLSMTPRAIPGVKAAIRNVQEDDARAQARHAQGYVTVASDN